MKAGHAHVTLVVDRSSSMGSVMPAAGSGVNEFIQAHKNAPGSCSFLLVEFDEHYNVVYGPGDIGRFDGPYTLQPRGMTALLDAVGRAITTTGNYLSNLPFSERPEKVIFVVQTDGEENSSKEFTFERIAEMVQHQTTHYSWEFLFLGADLEQAKGMGISNTYGNANTRASYAGTFTLASANTVASRSAGPQSFTYGTKTIGADGDIADAQS
jgi:hypothetical protein